MQEKLLNIWEGIKKALSQITADAVLNVLGSIAILFVGLYLIKRIMRIINPLLEKLKVDQGVVSFFKSAASFFLRFFLIVAVLINLGVPSASFIAMIGSAGLAIGLALQGSLSNFAGGLMILIFHPFKVGHFIQAQSVEGVVKEIGLFYTTIQSYDKKTIVLPNGLLTNGVISNTTFMGVRRISINIETLPDQDPKKVGYLLSKQAIKHPSVIVEDGIEARLNKIEAGRLVFVLRCFVKTENYWLTLLDLNEAIIAELNKENIALCPPRYMITEDNNQAQNK